MVKRKRKKSELEKDLFQGLAPPLILGGGAIGSSVLGGALQSRIPAGTTNPLTTTGQTLGNFTGPVAVIGASSIALKQLKRTEKKLQRRSKK